MVYEYHCPECRKRFDVIKSASEMEREETCGCGAVARRQFVPSRVHFIGTAVQHPEFNPGLGCIVKNSKHRTEVAKQKGLVEVGNEPVDKIHKHFEREREERREKAWSEADRGWVGNGDVDA